MRIKNIDISGLRGIKEQLSLSLDSSKSVLIYGDNGSGKSSITDSFEWFYYDRVEHLSTEEIGRKGINALRNISISDDDSYIDLKFSDSSMNSEKRLFYKRSKLISEYSNSSQNFNDYVKASSTENLILRYRDLLKFILFSKDAKLREISDIIGFSEVTRVKDILKKAVNKLRTEIKNKNIDSLISNKQDVIIGQISQNIYTDRQYFDAVGELVKPLKLPVEVKDNDSIDKILELIKTPEDDQALRLQLSYEKVIDSLTNISVSNKTILSSYKEYYKKYQDISKDLDKFKKISLEKLLTEALLILEKKIFEGDKCPLCLQVKNREELIAELRERIQDLTAFRKEKGQLENSRNTTEAVIETAVSQLDTALKEKCLTIAANAEIKSNIDNFRERYSTSLSNMRKITLMERKEIWEPESFLSIDLAKTEQVISTLKELKDKIAASKKDDLKFSINNKLIRVKDAYAEIKNFKKEKDLLDRQLRLFELVYGEFVKKQRDALSSFLQAISKDINEFYLYMNKAEEVDEIELIPLERDDELLGITIQFKFHDKVVSPPDKYLSESHLNCLGICLYLSSVKAFNKANKFFILDDVISSFDKGHRLRFANLLMEKFSDYQILLFTHEKDWFEYVVNMVKGKNWHVSVMVWDSKTGANLEIPLVDIKEKIEQKINKSDISGLGNLIRKYLERLLKEICFNSEVKMRFLFNDENENRMCNELLSELRAKLKKRKCDIKDHQVFERLSASIFLGNKTSHNSSFSENISDLKAFYDDVLELESIFLCNSCGKYISKKHYDTVGKIIRCKCGSKKYNWEK